MTQQKARNAPSRRHLVLWAVSLWHKRAGMSNINIQPMRAQSRRTSTNERWPLTSLLSGTRRPYSTATTAWRWRGLASAGPGLPGERDTAMWWVHLFCQFWTDLVNDLCKKIIIPFRFIFLKIDRQKAFSPSWNVRPPPTRLIAFWSARKLVIKATKRFAVGKQRKLT